MTNALRDATLEKGVVAGTAKVSRADGMFLVYDMKSNFLLRSAGSGAAVEQTSVTHLTRKAAAPAAPAPAPTGK